MTGRRGVPELDPFGPLDVRSLVSDIQLQRRDSDPSIATFLDTLPAVVRAAAEALGASSVVPVPVGWGGAVMRARCGDVDLAVKIPHRGLNTRAELAGALTLGGAGLGPAVLTHTADWYAMEWIDADPVGELLVPCTLDVGHLTTVAGALWSLATDGFGDLGDQWRRVTSISESRLVHLAAAGLNPERVVDRIGELTDELLACGRKGFCHGDLHPGNILADRGRWVLIDSRPGVGPQEADLAFLLAAAACGSPDPDVTRAVCARGGLDQELVEVWSMILAGEFFTSLCDGAPHRQAEIAGFASQLRRL